jgi:RNA polymerase sigma factor (sigma-70 family)
VRENLEMPFVLTVGQLRYEFATLHENTAMHEAGDQYALQLLGYGVDDRGLRSSPLPGLTYAPRREFPALASHRETSPMDKFEAWVAQTTSQYRRVRNTTDLSQLIDEARLGGQAAVSELTRRLGPELEEKLTRIDRGAREHATEVVNDVMLRLPTHLASYTEQGRFTQWLLGLVYNRWRTVRRGLARVPTDPMPAEDIEFPQAASGPARIDMEILRERAVGMLTDTEREAWLLFVEGFQRPEIGEMLGITANAAGVRLDRAKKRLKELLIAYI